MVGFICGRGPCDVVVREIVIFPRTCTTMIPRDALVVGSPHVFVISINKCAASVLLLGGNGLSFRCYHDLRSNVVAVGGRVVHGMGTLRSVAVSSRRVDSILYNERAVLPTSIVRAVANSAGGRTSGVLGRLHRLRISLESGPTVFINNNDVLLHPFFRGSRLVTGTDFISSPGTGTVNCRVLKGTRVGHRPGTWKVRKSL